MSELAKLFSCEKVKVTSHRIYLRLISIGISSDKRKLTKYDVINWVSCVRFKYDSDF